jgi:RNA polymerase subunit RPABC4/transcription elongation factor Spt4
MAEAMKGAFTSPSQAQNNKASGITCSSCGAQMPKGAKFCPECGNKNTAKFCTECGAKVSGGKFCPECGNKL